MRLSASSIVFLTLVLLVYACNTFDPSECFPNTSAGFGGAETIPIGAAVGAGSGDFASPPAGGPLDYGGGANPCMEPQSGCDQKCESKSNAAALECGRIENAAQRKSCQDAVYEAYKGCRENCQNEPNSKECTDKFVNCQNYAPKSCLKESGGKSVCRRCLERCNAGAPPSPQCKKCLF